MTAGGRVYTWGLGSSGQLGHGATSLMSTPTLVAGFHASAIAAGANFTAAVTGEAPTTADAQVPASGEIEVAQSSLLRVRAFVAGHAPGAIARADYELQLAAVTITPGTGTYLGAQTVTLATSDPLAALRYTVDGSTPDETSPLYAAPFLVSSTAVVQARAFRGGWTPSPATTAVLTIEQGTLAAPTIDPPSGVYPPTHAVTLTGPAGATLRYTTDDTEPTAASTLYTGPLTFPVGTTVLRARAYQAGWAPSAEAEASYQIDGTSLTIQARVVPAAINGWHHIAPTVSFVCDDEGAGSAVCPDPVTVATDGTGVIVTGTAVNAAGNTASASVTLNLDRVAPLVEIVSSSPSTPFTTATTATLVAAVSDALSGVQSARCNADAASVDDGVVTCTVNLRPGGNSLIVDVLDAAGNSASSSVHITRVGTPTALRITPATLTLLMGDERVIQVLDDFGQPAPSGLDWTTLDPDVAEIEDRADGPTVVARGVGTTDVTGAVGGLVQTLTVTVLSATAELEGVSAWTSPPGGDAVTYAVARGAPDRNGTTVLALEQDGAGGLIRAVGPLGHTKWHIPIPGGESVSEAFALADGGTVVRTGSAIVRLPHPDGGSAWRFPADVVAVGRTPESNVVALVQSAYHADRELVSLDGVSGTVRWRHALPRSPGHVSFNVDCSMGYHTGGDETAAATRALTIDEQGTTFLYVVTDSSYFDNAVGGYCEMYAYGLSGDLSLMAVTDSGALSTSSLRSYAVSGSGPAGSFELPPYTVGEPGTMVPVADGGVVATYTDVTVVGSNILNSTTVLTTFGTGASFTNHYASGAKVVADGEDGHVVVKDDALTRVIDTSSGATTATYTGDLVEVLAGNEVLMAQDGQIEHRDAAGGLVQTAAAALQGAVRVAQAIWAKVDHEFGAGLGGLYGLPSHPANALFPGGGAVASLFGYPAVPVVRNLTDVDVVVKNGGCHAGFSTVPAHGNYYRWVDGVRPGAVTGWNADDWFKVPDLAHVVVRPNGAQPTAHGPSTVLLPGSTKFCRQDDDTQPNYHDCWGRRIQPKWSDPKPDGFGEDTWIEPRPPGVVCGAEPKWWEVKKWW